MHQLRELGISAEAEAIYLDLMARGALSTEEVADGTPASVDVRLEELAAVGLIEALARGVTYEVIYGTQVLQDSEALRKVQLWVDAGEQARVFPQVPLNLTIVDDRWALLSARTTVGGITSTRGDGGAPFAVPDRSRRGVRRPDAVPARSTGLSAAVVVGVAGRPCREREVGSDVADRRPRYGVATTDQKERD